MQNKSEEESFENIDMAGLYIWMRQNFFNRRAPKETALKQRSKRVSGDEKQMRQHQGETNITGIERV